MASGDESMPPEKVRHQRPRKWSSEVLQDLALSSFLVVIPVLVLGAMLLYLVLAYRVHYNHDLSAYFETYANTSKSNVFYVRYDASRITTVASWASSVAVLLPGFAMTLYAFVFARDFAASAAMERTNELPTAYQIALALGIKTGGLASFWKTASYIFSKKRSSAPRSFVYGLLIFFVALLLGYLTVLADTWLHIATTTITFEQVFPSANVEYKYSAELPSGCTSGAAGGCVTTPKNTYAGDDGGSNGDPRLLSPANFYLASNNKSSNYTIQTATVQSSNRISYLAPVSTDSKVDYRAYTIAAQSNCSVMTSRCYPFVSWEDEWVSNGTDLCATSIPGGGTTDYKVLSAYYADAAWTKAIISEDIDKSSGDANCSNPFYTMFNMDVAEYAMTIGGSPSFGDQVYSTGAYSTRNVVIGCETHLHHMNYTVVQGAMTDVQIEPIENRKTISRLFQPTEFAFFDNTIDTAAILAYNLPTLESALQSFTDTYSSTFIVSAATVANPVANIAEQIREGILVARIPAAPLFALLACLFLSGAFGIFMVILAMTYSPLKGSFAYLRLTVAGLASSKFEDLGNHGQHAFTSTSELFYETSSGTKPVRVRRIGLAVPEHGGGVDYVTWNMTEDGGSNSNGPGADDHHNDIRLKKLKSNGNVDETEVLDDHAPHGAPAPESQTLLLDNDRFVENDDPDGNAQTTPGSAVESVYPSMNEHWMSDYFTYSQYLEQVNQTRNSQTTDADRKIRRKPVGQADMSR